MNGQLREPPVLAAEGLVKRFPTGRRGVSVNAVNGVSLSLARGETVGLVGESGSGKSTIGLMVARLLPVTEGRIAFLGEDVTALSDRAFRPRRKALQIVFQDPWSALNPRMSIARLLEEPFRLHTDLDAGSRRTEAAALADRVNLPRASLARFPHELSGGQLQRVCIARAIATNPSLIVLDEPTSSLDLSVRAGILRLLDELEAETHVAMLFISHDLDTVELISDRVLVLYLGTVVEEGPADQVFAAPAHPYTQMLMSAHLPPDPGTRPVRVLPQGEIPSPIDLPPGCPFVSRCPLAEPRCRDSMPPAHPAGPGHAARCVRVPEGTSRIVPA